MIVLPEKPEGSLLNITSYLFGSSIPYPCFARISGSCLRNRPRVIDLKIFKGKTIISMRNGGI